MKLKYFISGIMGIICGILSTYPVELRFLPCIIFWGVVGLVLGLFIQGKREIILAGALYGILLAIAFLFSRFGGTSDKFAGYALFVALASIFSTAGGIAMVFAGSKLRARFQRKAE